MKMQEDDNEKKYDEIVLKFHNRFKTDPEWIKMLEESKNRRRYYQAIQSIKNRNSVSGNEILKN